MAMNADTRQITQVGHDQSVLHTQNIAHEMSSKDDEALSSLLLLLKSTSNRPDASSTLPQNAVDAPLLTGGVEPVGDFHHPAYLQAAHAAMTRNSSRVCIDFQTLRHYFHLPLAQAAKVLGTCTTSLKKICRKHNIERWPCRQIRSLTKYLTTLQRACLNINVPPSMRCQYRDEMRVVEKALVDITENPNVDLSHIVTTNKRNRKRQESGDESESDSEGNGDADTDDRSASPVMYNYIESHDTLLPNPPETRPDEGEGGSISPPPSGSLRSHGNGEIHNESKADASTEAISSIDGDREESAEPSASECVGEDGKIIKKPRRILKREDTSYNHQTGWIAGCSRCGKLGKYRSPAEGRPFQHSTGVGRYCGYFRLNPRRGFTQGNRQKTYLGRNPAVPLDAFDPTSQYMYMLSNGLMPNLFTKISSSGGQSGMTPQRPQLASVHSIGITGMGQLMPPMTVHDGMAEPGSEGTMPAPPSELNASSAPGPVRLSTGAMGKVSNSGSGEGTDEYSLQQYANAVLGHVSPQPRQHQLYRTEMVTYMSSQPSQRYLSADTMSSFSGMVRRPIRAPAGFNVMPPRHALLSSDEPSRAALLASALTTLTATTPTTQPNEAVSISAPSAAIVSTSSSGIALQPPTHPSEAPETRFPTSSKSVSDHGVSPVGNVVSSSMNRTTVVPPQVHTAAAVREVAAPTVRPDAPLVRPNTAPVPPPACSNLTVEGDTT